MTRFQRLVLYIRTHKLYKKALKDPVFIRTYYLYGGLCYTLEMNFKTNAGYHMQYELPELYAQKPENVFGMFWFPQGELKPRLKCLRNAIILTLKFWK